MGAETKILPKKTSAPLPLGIFAGVVLGATTVGAGVMIFCFNPSTRGFYPAFGVHAVTGLNCPGCGATRALYALLHGHWRLAVKDNVLFMALLAALAVWGSRLPVRKMRSQPAAFSLPAKFLWTSLAVAVVFAVVRNVPGFEWLSP